MDVKKLNRESSFVVESELGVAGIRGTQFGLSADADSTELAVLEGRVGFLDANQKAKSVETAQKVAGSEDGAGEVDALADSEKAELAKAVADSQESASEYDLTRLANTVDGYAPKPNYIVKSALNMELIWCPPGSFIMGNNREDSAAHPVILTKGFYLGKYEVTQEEYKIVMKNNPSEFKGERLPVEMVSWREAVAFCDLLTKKERKQGWKFSYLPKPNGSMLVELEQELDIQLKVQLLNLLIVMPVALEKLLKLENTYQTIGVFTMCMEMFGNGVTIFMEHIQKNLQKIH